MNDKATPTCMFRMHVAPCPMLEHIGRGVFCMKFISDMVYQSQL